MKRLTTGDLARILKCTDETIRNYCKRGIGPKFEVDMVGRYHFDRADVEEWLAERDLELISVPKSLMERAFRL